ncbi:unnamed protein product [Camellia sinensis]
MTMTSSGYRAILRITKPKSQAEVLTGRKENLVKLLRFYACFSFTSVSGVMTDLTVVYFFADSAHLASHYSYPNLNILRAALRIKERSWTKLLNFEPTYRYSGR